MPAINFSHFSPTTPLLTPCQLTSPFLTGGWSQFTSHWLYSSCLDTTVSLISDHAFPVMIPLETCRSDNIRRPFVYYFPMALFSPQEVLKLGFAFLESQTLGVNDSGALACLWHQPRTQRQHLPPHTEHLTVGSIILQGCAQWFPRKATKMPHVFTFPCESSIRKSTQATCGLEIVGAVSIMSCRWYAVNIPHL